MHSLILTVRKTIERLNMLRPRERVLAGVSGGADSVCMALILKELGYEVVMAHMNHGLRGTAADEDEEHQRDQSAQTKVLKVLRLPW